MSPSIEPMDLAQWDGDMMSASDIECALIGIRFLSMMRIIFTLLFEQLLCVSMLGVGCFKL